MLRLIDERDLRMVEKVLNWDPFQLSTPAWQTPPQFDTWLPRMRLTKDQQRRKDLEIIMSIRLVQEKEAPVRMFGKGKVANTAEYREVLSMMKNVPEGKAIVVTLENEELLKVKKPELTFAYAIRRYLAKHNIAATAYQSGKLEVVVRRDSGGSVPRKRSK